MFLTFEAFTPSLLLKLYTRAVEFSRCKILTEAFVINYGGGPEWWSVYCFLSLTDCCCQSATGDGRNAVLDTFDAILVSIPIYGVYLSLPILTIYIDIVW